MASKMAYAGIFDTINIEQGKPIKEKNEIQQELDEDSGSEDSEDSSDSSDEESDDEYDNPERPISKSLQYFVLIGLLLVTLAGVLHMDWMPNQNDTPWALIKPQVDKTFKLITDTTNEIFDVVAKRVISIFSLGGFLIYRVYKEISEGMGY